MCGIILAPRVYRDLVPAALASMGYRGTEPPDSEDWAGWVLGHVRLPLQAGSVAQPLFPGEDRNLTAFVGELFEQDDEVGAVAWAMSSDSLKGFMDASFDGFWAVVDVDTYGRARVVTDHLGIKPMYYWEKFGIVCSEIEPMFLLEKAPELDETYLSNCIKWGYDCTGRTPYQGIKQLPPGTCLTLDPIGGPRYFPYWDWDIVEGNHIGTSLGPRLLNAVRNRLKGSEDVALLLSGGLDSSILHALITKSLRREDVSLFSLANGVDEHYLPQGENVWMLDPESVTPELAVSLMQAPLDLGSLLPQIQLSRVLGAEGKGFKVCLTGDGADELFGGYSRAATFDSQYSDVFCELPYYHLPRLDRIPMRSTMELRAPFLAPSVVSFALQLPWRERQGDKKVLKRTFGDLVDPRVRNRSKHALKSPEVTVGGLEYRKQLVRAFRTHADLLRHAN